MTSYNWQSFLAQLSADILKSDLQKQFQHILPAHSQERQWLGFDGASEQEIEALERKLNVQLPPSYRSFLLTTNGWSIVNAFVWKLSPVSDLHWYRATSQEMIDIIRMSERDKRMIARMRKQGEVFISARELKDALDVSASFEGYTDAIDYVLVQPEDPAKTEWDAWVLRWWKPTDFRKYASFWELMQAEYQVFQAMQR